MTWKDQIAPKQIFSQKTTKKIFMYLLVPFLSRIKKKKTEGRFKVKRTPYHFCFKITKLLWIQYDFFQKNH